MTVAAHGENIHCFSAGSHILHIRVINPATGIAIDKQFALGLWAEAVIVRPAHPTRIRYDGKERRPRRHARR
jgi:hypothetical protein